MGAVEFDGYGGVPTVRYHPLCHVCGKRVETVVCTRDLPHRKINFVAKCHGACEDFDIDEDLLDEKEPTSILAVLPPMIFLKGPGIEGPMAVDGAMTNFERELEELWDSI